jgi:hypothetical protein
MESAKPIPKDKGLIDLRDLLPSFFLTEQLMLLRIISAASVFQRIRVFLCRGAPRERLVGFDVAVPDDLIDGLD